MTEFTLRAGAGIEKRDLMERCGGVFPDFMEGKSDDGTRYITAKVECEVDDLTPEFQTSRIIASAKAFGASSEDLIELESLVLQAYQRFYK